MQNVPGASAVSRTSLSSAAPSVTRTRLPPLTATLAAAPLPSSARALGCTVTCGPTTRLSAGQTVRGLLARIFRMHHLQI